MLYETLISQGQYGLTQLFKVEIGYLMNQQANKKIINICHTSCRENIRPPEVNNQLLYPGNAEAV